MRSSSVSATSHSMVRACRDVRDRDWAHMGSLTSQGLVSRWRFQSQTWQTASFTLSRRLCLVIPSSWLASTCCFQVRHQVLIEASGLGGQQVTLWACCLEEATIYSLGCTARASRMASHLWDLCTMTKSASQMRMKRRANLWQQKISVKSQPLTSSLRHSHSRGRGRRL